MRLLRRDVEGAFELTEELVEEQLPKYAVLSHTWLLENGAEVSFQDLTRGDAGSKPDGYAKIRFCGEQATKDGLEHFWLDTCCINKESSAEIQEAITSMFSWYQNADRCYVYLSDVSVEHTDHDESNKLPPTCLWGTAFRQSRWFTRGWTLQELLAPKSVEFFSKEGKRLGDRESLGQMIHEITKIPVEALRGDSLSNFSVEERLKWAENRQTKCIEDKAYCLLGVFRIRISLRYGEGDFAFKRLRRKIGNEDVAPNPLSMLPVATEAAFNSLHNQHEPTCLPNTRAELLTHIETWAEGTDKRCVFWLNGIAGTGKSTVARTIARTYYDRGILGGSFFFLKGGGDLSKANKLVTTLVRQLATLVPDAKQHICEAIEKQEDIMDHSFRDQWKHLIAGPLSRLSNRPAKSRVLLVVDALDECDNENDIRAILRILTTANSLKNVLLRIFITSRPETTIRHGFNKIPDDEREVFVLQEILRDVVNQDLSVYFQEKLKTIREERGFDDDWPGGRVIKRLVENAYGLFIWAATACRFISEGRRLSTIKKRIDKLINGLSSGGGPEQKLDQIYTAVLQDFVRQVSDEQERKELNVVLKQVLGTIAILYSPLPMEPLSTLLGTPLSDVKDTLTDLQTIFYIPSNIPDQEPHPVRLHHPTFRDFLLNKERSIELDFRVDEKEAHRALGDRCLALMSKMLHSDMCYLKSPGSLVKDLEPERMRCCIPSDLQYACLYWVEHYRQSGIRLSDGDPIHDFFKEYFLYWLEAINLMGKSAEMGAIIRLYHSLLAVCAPYAHGRLTSLLTWAMFFQPDCNVRQIPFVKDARRLIFNFQNIIREAPLQVYCAALAFMPPTNELKVHFRAQMHPWIQDIRIAQANVPKAKNDFNYVSDLAFTPDGRQIASGSNFEAVRFWDVKTKTTLRKYQGGSTDKMSSIAISPDGKTLAGGSDDFTVMAWDIETGALHYSIKAHTGWVNSVAFSSDGKLLASGSMDQTVALWDAATGQEVNRINNQLACVNSAAFSPDGRFVATGSVDKILRLWHASAGPDEIHMMLDGHSGPINSIRFSPSGKQIVSGSDDMTIKLWDTATGAECMTLRGHTKKVMAVVFSPDARLVASGSEDKAVRLWDATSGALLVTLPDHTSDINSVLFSPDGTLLASSSFDDEVRLWNAQSRTLMGKLDDFEEDYNWGTLATQRPYLPASSEAIQTLKELRGHTNSVTRVMFSPDGRWLASGSKDGTIKLWLESRERWTLEGHSGEINNLVFSPDCHLLASTSTDRTVRLWNCATGTASYRLQGHSGNILLVPFSPNGQLLGSCSADNTVRLWDPATGAELGILQGRSGAVNGLAFSPCNRSVVSWLVDGTACLWDLSTKTLSAVLEGHSGPVSSVAFSQDGQLFVSCSEDATVRLWNKEGVSCRKIESDLPVSVAALSPDNQILACSSATSTVPLWD
ncbi:hypothetical protein ACHAPT_012594, partial [Fusarium lateritium]